MTDFKYDSISDPKEEKNKSKTSYRERTRIVDSAKASYEQRFQKATATDLAGAGFTEEELVKQRAIEKEFQEMAKDCEGDSIKFLQKLADRGVLIFENSKYIDFLQELQFKDHTQISEEAKITHGCFTRKTVAESQLEHLLGKSLPSEVIKELELTTNNANGAIFLGSTISNVTRWHEGLHALQMFHNWDSPRIPPKHEVGVDVILFRSQAAGILTDLTKGDFIETDTGFNFSVSPKNNDVYDELDYFESNLAKVNI